MLLIKFHTCSSKISVHVLVIRSIIRCVILSVNCFRNSVASTKEMFLRLLKNCGKRVISDL